MGLLRDRSEEFEAVGVRVFGISRDSAYSHVAWTEVLDLNFPLLSDWNGEAVDGFGATQADYRGMRGVAERAAFLIDEGGTVRGAWRYERSEVPEMDELLSAARALSA
ncbi:MAG: redoxin domain-containing protein [Gaiellaceae bacterium]